MTNPTTTPITVNDTQVGAIVTNREGNWEGFMLTADGAGYLPISFGNNPEFSQSAHAEEAVVSEYRTLQARTARLAARPTIGDRVTLPANGAPDPTRWVATTIDHSGVTVGHLDYEIEETYTWPDFDALVASR